MKETEDLTPNLDQSTAPRWFSPSRMFAAIKEMKQIQREIREEERNYRFAVRNGLPLLDRGGTVSLLPSAEADDHLLIAAELNIRDGREPGYGHSSDRAEPPEAA